MMKNQGPTYLFISSGCVTFLFFTADIILTTLNTDNKLPNSNWQHNLVLLLSASVSPVKRFYFKDAHIKFSLQFFFCLHLIKTHHSAISQVKKNIYSFLFARIISCKSLTYIQAHLKLLTIWNAVCRACYARFCTLHITGKRSSCRCLHEFDVAENKWFECLPRMFVFKAPELFLGWLVLWACQTHSEMNPAFLLSLYIYIYKKYFWICQAWIYE